MFLPSITIFSVYIAILAVLSFTAYRKENQDGYIIGQRKLGVFSTVCSMLAGQFNGGGVFFTFTFGIIVGYGKLWIGLGVFLGYLLLSFFASTVYEEGKKHGDINVPDILKRRIGKYTQYFSSFLIVGKACLFGTAQILIAGTVASIIFGIPSAVGISLTALIIACYVCLGGYLTVVRTDILQWGLLFAITIAAVLFIPLPSFSEVFEDVVDTPDVMKSGFALFTFMLIVSNADAWQRMMSVRSGEVAKKSLLFSGLLFVVFIFSMTVIVKSLGVNSDVGFFDLFKERMLSPIALSFLGMFTLIAVMSTIDTQVQLFSSALSKNIFKLDIEKNKKKFIKTSRVASIVLLAVIAFVASTLGSTIEFVLKAFSFAYILAPVMIFSMIWGKDGSKFKDYSCIIALIVGLCIYVYMFFNSYFAVMLNNVIPASVTGLICLLCFSGQKLHRFCNGLVEKK